MDTFLFGLLGGAVPGVIMLLIYFASVAGRFARIENDVCWLKKYIEKCLPHLKNHSL